MYPEKCLLVHTTVMSEKYNITFQDIIIAQMICFHFSKYASSPLRIVTPTFNYIKISG